MFLSIQKCFNISYKCFCRLCQLVMFLGLSVKLSFVDQEQRSLSRVPQRVGKEDVPQELTWGNSEAGQNIRRQIDCFYLLPLHPPGEHRTISCGRWCCHWGPCPNCSPMDRSQFHSCSSPTGEDLLLPQLCQCKFICKLSKLDPWSVWLPRHLSSC